MAVNPSAVQYLPLSGGTLTGPLTLSPGGQAFPLQAATPAAGFALQNATPTIVSWVVPNDGALHYCLVGGSVDVTVAETGGAIIGNAKDPGGNVLGPQLDPGAHAAGVFAFTSRILQVQAGETVSVSQSAALTAGAATCWAAIWGF